MNIRAALGCTALAIAAVSLAACDPTDVTPTVTAPTTVGPSASPSTPNPTPTTPAPTPTPFDYLTFGDEMSIPMSQDGAAYSGCSPGSDVLPTGIYIGYVNQWSMQEVHFDLICMWNGDAANEHMIADGIEPDPYMEDPWYITNDNPAIRVVPIGLGGNIEARDCDFQVLPLADFLADPGGSIADFGSPYLIRIYVTNGEITAIGCHFLP